MKKSIRCCVRAFLTTITYFAIFSSITAYCASVTLQWDPNDPPPEGYSLYARLVDQSYDYNNPVWKGSESSCTVDGLSDGTTYYFVVRAYDGEIESGDSNEVIYTTPDGPVGNRAPVADAGTAINVVEEDLVTLDGSGSSDPDNNIVSYSWVQTEGPLVSISDAQTINPSFTAPVITSSGISLSFQLTITDQGGLTSTDSCTVFVVKSQSTDRDGDHVPDVLDAFPDDPDEWVDFDGDGIGDNEDLDDDNDGMSDIWENRYGLNPFKNDSDGDADGDGVTNYEEYESGSDPTQALTNDTPDKPLLLSPASTDTVNLTPVLVSEAYFDKDGDLHAKSQWQMSMDSDFSTCVLDIVSTTQLTSYKVIDLTLETDTIYYWRVKFFDERNGESNWSETAFFTTIEAQDSNDTDENGKPDDQEVDPPEDTQPSIMWVSTVQGDSMVGVMSNTPDAHIVSVMSIPYDQEQYGGEDTVEMPYGLVSFKLNLYNGVKTATVIIHFEEAAPEDALWMKYNADTGWRAYEHAVFAHDRKSVAITLVDGGIGDEDGIENGVIIDPSGLGFDNDRSLSTDDIIADVSGGNLSCFISTSVGSDTGNPVFLILLLCLAMAAFLISSNKVNGRPVKAKTDTESL